MEKPSGWLDKVGGDLLSNGFKIIPIPRGTKVPDIKDWQKIEASPGDLKKWLSNGHARAGCGIITGQVIGVDIDVLTESMAKDLEQWCLENIGAAPVRVGKAPKRLLVYRTAPDVTFGKVNSPKFDDPSLPDNEKGKRQVNKIEILAEGQQFVAYGVHPDTKKPYQWLYGAPLTDYDADGLSIITQDDIDNLIEHYGELASEQGWKQIKSTALVTTERQPRGAIDRDDPFADVAQKTEHTEEQLAELLEAVPGAEDHDLWVQIGMALYHQFDGSESGRDVWDKWSSTADNYDPDEIPKRWKSFSIDRKNRSPVTARLILKIAKENTTAASAELIEALKDRFREASTQAELEDDAREAKTLEMQQADRDVLLGLLRTAFKRITGQQLAMTTARAMLRHERSAEDVKAKPDWLKSWVYLGGDDKFFNLRSQVSYTPSAFNSMFSSEMLSKQDLLEGMSVPSTMPNTFALNVVRIPKVATTRYMPGYEHVFSMEGVKYANSYSLGPQHEMPEDLSFDEEIDIERVIAHMSHLFSDERERKLLLDWMGYVVQNPGQRVNWAILMQGVEGDGKSFFMQLMATAMGSKHISVVKPKNLEEGFNGWAEGHRLVFVEEVKMHGHNRFDVLNSIKDLITNTAIAIRRMRTDTYTVPNMASYMLTTNFKDAMPLSRGDTRYFVMFSRFTRIEQVEKFNIDNPTYYPNLFDALQRSPGAIRKWLMTHKVSEDFNPKARAPKSVGKDYMSGMAKSENQELLESIFEEEPRRDLCPELVCVSTLREVFFDNDVIDFPDKPLGQMLSSMGFEKLGQIMVNGKRDRFWSMNGERFKHSGKLDKNLVRIYLENDL